MKINDLLVSATVVFLLIGALWQFSIAQADPPPTRSAYLPHVRSPKATPKPTSTALPPPCTDCSYNAHSCVDFDTQQQAQACFDHCYEVAGRDIHRLVADNDMIACEHLP